MKSWIAGTFQPIRKHKITVSDCCHAEVYPTIDGTAQVCDNCAEVCDTEEIETREMI